MSSSDQSFRSLLRELVDEVAQLIRQELRLAQAEMTEKARGARHGATSIAVGAMLGFAALLILLQALVVALSAVVEPWLASGIVGVVTAAVAMILIKSGQSRLDPRNLAPERTLRSARQQSGLASGRAQ